jgi:thiamine-phosphate pyrophosphorylase
MPRGADAVLRLELYLVTDPDLAGDRPLLQVVTAALEGGATAVQLRDKKASPRELLRWGEELRRIAHHHNAACIVNDRVDLALALEADGVHLGPEDLPPAEARRLMPRPRWMGVSAGSVQEAMAAQEAGADYLGAGPVFATPTKRDAGGPIGPEGLAAITASVVIPVVGIGGINARNAASVIEAGAAGVAVISALMAAENPEGEARAILAVVREALHGRARHRSSSNGSLEG